MYRLEIEALIHDIAAPLTYRDRLLLCYIKYEFNSSEDVDKPWAFYFDSQRNGYFANLVLWCNRETGENMAVDTAFLIFAQIKVYTKFYIWKYANTI
jgi:hypothetical protein